MSIVRTAPLVAAALIATLLAPAAPRAEDGVFFSGIQAGELASTRANSFMSAVPGGRFVITVAHLAPSPEDAVVRGVPATCETVHFRIDTLTVNRADGEVEVELGDVQAVDAGRASTMVHEVAPSSGPPVPASDLDLMGFRLRAEKASSRCGIVASGLFYPDAATTSPLPVALIPNIGASPRVTPTAGR